MKKQHTQAPGQRQLRVGEELRHALARLIERGALHDPDLAGVALTITEVRMSPDLRNATVYVVPLGGGKDQTYLTALARAQPFLRREVARNLRLRFTPKLSFAADGSFDEASHIENLLNSPDVARDLTDDPAED